MHLLRGELTGCLSRIVPCSILSGYLTRLSLILYSITRLLLRAAVDVVDALLVVAVALVVVVVVP